MNSHTQSNIARFAIACEPRRKQGTVSLLGHLSRPQYLLFRAAQAWRFYFRRRAAPPWFLLSPQRHCLLIVLLPSADLPLLLDLLTEFLRFSSNFAHIVWLLLDSGFRRSLFMYMPKVLPLHLPFWVSLCLPFVLPFRVSVIEADFRAS